MAPTEAIGALGSAPDTGPISITATAAVSI